MPTWYNPADENFCFRLSRSLCALRATCDLLGPKTLTGKNMKTDVTSGFDGFRCLTAIALIGLILPNITQAQQGQSSSTEVRLASEIAWQHLNPARGDASPQAGTIWGDQTKDGESGFLVKFVDGFSSPPHVHNITYRGIVLGGGLHNDDPESEPLWMPVGSYWTQPAGEVHITAARGASIGYVEIQSGPQGDCTVNPYWGRTFSR